jgi:plastocyanin
MNGMRKMVAGAFLSVAIASAAVAASAQPAETLAVHLSNFEFNPDQIRLRAGVPIHLLLVNDSGGGHNFTAPGFFAASTLVSGVAPHDGTVEVPGGATVELTMIPRMPGTYKLECTHFLHSLFGMTGTIVVEAPAK